MPTMKLNNLVFADVDKKVIQKMREMLAAIPNKRIFIPEKFKDYCIRIFCSFLNALL